MSSRLFKYQSFIRKFNAQTTEASFYIYDRPPWVEIADKIWISVFQSNSFYNEEKLKSGFIYVSFHDKCHIKKQPMANCRTNIIH